MGFLLTAKLSTSEKWERGMTGALKRSAYGNDAESVVSLCSRGEEQGILVMPQASLVSDVGGEDFGLSYEKLCSKDDAQNLYTVFLEALSKTASELISGPTPANGNPFARGV